MEYVGGMNRDYMVASPRPLAAFRGDTLLACGDDKRTLFRRDFTAADVTAFPDVWFNQRQLPRKVNPTADRSREVRLAKGAAWSKDLFGGAEPRQRIAGVLLAGDAAFVAGTQGGLCVVAVADGKTLARHDLPAPAWDGLAAARGHLYVSTADGKVLCLGRK
jgi:hypothetical protein